jgi:hypothetical protein
MIGKGEFIMKDIVVDGLYRFCWGREKWEVVIVIFLYGIIVNRNKFSDIWRVMV